MYPWMKLLRRWRRRSPALRSACTVAAVVACLAVPLSTLLAANDAPPQLNARRYSIDPFRSYLEFSVGFMRIKTAEGTFHEYTGTIMHSEGDFTRSTVTAVIDAASIFTGVKPRDNHLRSADFFEVETYPYIVFRSSKVRPQGAGWALGGELTLHGTTRPVEILFVREEGNGDRSRLTFSGKLSLKRRDYGVIGNFWGNQVLGNEVSVTLHIEAAPVEEGSFSPPRFTPRTLSEPLLEPALNHDPAALRNAYSALRVTAPDQYDFSETGLLELAVELQRRNELEAAERVLRFNLENFPRHSTSRDFLGYLLALQGRLDEALETYRSLSRQNPYHSGALEMLRWLTGKTESGGQSLR